MLDFQKKKKLRKVLYSPITLIILAVIFIVFSSGVFGVYKKARLSSENLEREKNELEKLTIRQENLASSIDYLKTEQGTEDEIRTKFRLVKEGEKVVVIIDNKDPKEEATITDEKSLWYKLFYWPQY